MFSLKQVLTLIIAMNFVVLTILLVSNPTSGSAHDVDYEASLRKAPKSPANFASPKSGTQARKALPRVKPPTGKTDKADFPHTKDENPFHILGGYQELTKKYFNAYNSRKTRFWQPNYGLKHHENYCPTVDLYHLENPNQTFVEMNFFTDYSKQGLPRKMVMRKIGNDVMPMVSRYMNKVRKFSRLFHLKKRINMYFTKKVDMQLQHKLGVHFLCATQSYNHIPGHGTLKRKDYLVASVDRYAKKFERENRPQCFNKEMFFPKSWRLYREDECKQFFEIFQSADFAEKNQTYPIQYLLKSGFGRHKGAGIFLFDADKQAWFNRTYRGGKGCGKVKKSRIAQTYLTNPLLLNLHNKFDFRIYLLIASTNPLIAYYCDGFLKLSLHNYSTNSTEKNAHLSNTWLSQDLFDKAKTEKVHGMNANELKAYQMWFLPEFLEYMMKIGRVNSSTWLDDYLRPQFQTAFIHAVQMSQHTFWKQSNVWELFGMDFMLDDDLKLWFIECNASPQLLATSDRKAEILTKMLKDLFEIQFAYQRSRMKRAFAVIKEYQAAKVEGTASLEKYSKLYQEAMKNRLEPEYEIREENVFVKIMDLNEEGAKAYKKGLIADECL